MAAKKQIDTLGTLYISTSVMNCSLAVSGDKQFRSKRIIFCVGRNRSFHRGCTISADTYLFPLSFGFPVGVHGTPEPIACPPTTFFAGAIPGNDHLNFLSFWWKEIFQAPREEDKYANAKSNSQ